MANPYVTDRPLTSQDHFIGREREIVALTQAWQTEQRLHLLYGKRGIGKTSLLNQLPLRLTGRHPLVRVEWASTAEAGRDVVTRVVWAVGQALGWPQLELPDPRNPYAQLVGYFERGAAPVREGDPAPSEPMVCIDGLPLDDCGPGSGWAQALDSLNGLLKGGRVAVVLVIEARPEECEADGASLQPIVLGGLSQPETEDLLLVPARGQLTYDMESMRRVFALTGGEPFLVQLYGSALFERRAQRGWVNLIETDQAVVQVIEGAAEQFSQLWSRCSVRARIILCVFSEGIGTHGMGSADDIRRRLLRERVEMSLADIEGALDELRQRDMIERLGGGLFRFRNALFLLWLRDNRNLADTVRHSREYKRLPRPSVPPILNRRFDWVGLSLWVVIIGLVVAIGSVWRSRTTQIVWTNEPPTGTPQAEGNVPVAAVTGVPGALSGEIAYMAKAEAGAYWDIYLMSLGGGEPVRLTQGAGDNSLPAWSPDGQRLAFVSDRAGNRDVWVMAADGSNPVNLTQDAGEDWTPTWSPDGERLAFASFRDGNWEIYTMNADGTGQARVTDAPSADYSPVWSPDGDTLAFVSDRSGQLDIYLMAPDGTEVRALSTDPGTDQSPAWSHDGRKLLWEGYREGNMEIMAVDMAGGEPYTLSQDAYSDDHGGTWAPSDGQIAFFSNRDGGWDIYTLDLRTGERANLTESVAIEQYPAFKP